MKTQIVPIPRQFCHPQGILVLAPTPSEKNRLKSRPVILALVLLILVSAIGSMIIFETEAEPGKMIGNRSAIEK